MNSENTYNEGCYFSVPLRNGGYARGVVARLITGTGRHAFLGYFFGPKLLNLNDVKPDGLSPPCAVLRVICGDLGLHEGEWKVCGFVPGWARGDWPFPEFVQRDLINKRAWIVKYADEDGRRLPAKEPADWRITLANDSLFGAGAVEIKLTKILAI